MSKIAVLVLTLYFVWRVLSSLGKRLGDDGAGADEFSQFSARRRDLSWRRARRDAATRGDGSEDLVACDRCGVHVPATSLVAGDDGGRYCSASCVTAS